MSIPPEEKSKALDQAVATMFPFSLVRGYRLLSIIVLTMVAFVALAVTFQFVVLYRNQGIIKDQQALIRRHQQEIDASITQQIPSLRHQLRVRDATIQDYEHIVNEDAVPAILAMVKQIRELGGIPPEVLLSPPPRKPNDPRGQVDPPQQPGKG